MGAVALAADAAAQAAREHARTGQRGKEISLRPARTGWPARRNTNTGGRFRGPPLPITDREREIAMLAAAGLSNRQIADRLVVSVRTVEGHVYRIFAKLGIERPRPAHPLGMSRLAET